VQATADGVPAQALDLVARADHHQQHPGAGQAGVEHPSGALGLPETVHGGQDGGALQSLEAQHVAVEHVSVGEEVVPVGGVSAVVDGTGGCLSQRLWGQRRSGSFASQPGVEWSTHREST